MSKKRVFISGPYTQGYTPENVKIAMDVANDIMDLGHYPFCPHLFHFMEINHRRPYLDWIDLDNTFLRACDVVLRLPGESEGADKEVALAQRLDIPVVYSLKDL